MRALAALSTFTLLFLGVYGDSEWWKSMSLYQIYPRSFKDSDGDGIGDLKGIQSKLQYLADSKIDGFWISPIFPSPMVDFGYDISDFVGIDSIFGTMKDFENLLKEAHKLSLKVILDFVPNHSSDKHEWFQKSIKRIEPYTDYYVWHDGKIVEGVRQPPNNWVSIFYGYAWTWNEERQQYYLHQFAPEQPDLNFRNPLVVEAVKDVLRFWLNKGVNGFRIDAIPFLFEVKDFQDEPLSGNTDDPKSSEYLQHDYTQHLDETYEMLRQWRAVTDEYKDNGEQRILMAEAYANRTRTMDYYKYGAHFPFNFDLIKYTNGSSSAQDIKNVVDSWMESMPPGAEANWVTGNHDQSRLTSRYGVDFASAITMMVQLFPGVAVTYYGDEIGMENTWLSYEETKDPQGCNTGPSGYEKASRDPARTPFQWDNTTSAGFSTNRNTWLRVNDNYKTVNLATEKAAPNSYYNSFLKASELRRWPVVKKGSLQTKLLNDNVFAFSRELASENSVYVVINFANQSQTVNLETFENAPTKVRVYHATREIGDREGSIERVQDLSIPARAAIIFIADE